ncbi:hypothetical protein [Microcoleus sp. bin38.metabat.b11b12b14.051]|uniref:hypothetical protein n=1 Tax=Microcoleus sp. bin38.metabat.b11b12b14.051 TaxID=2742709 RepID=UPI0025F13574|nr:hypothetical protein [Microcoleus sp. bin38.metabat.b11b12b14.051]
MSNKLFKTGRSPSNWHSPPRIYILFAIIFLAETGTPSDRLWLPRRRLPLQNTVYTWRPLREIARSASISHIAPKPGTAAREGSTSNQLVLGRHLIGQACMTVATGARYQSILKPSIHAGHSLRDSYASRLFPLAVTLISFPDDPHQLNCRYTPLQTLTIPLIIETSSEH